MLSSSSVVTIACLCGPLANATALVGPGAETMTQRSRDIIVPGRRAVLAARATAHGDMLPGAEHGVDIRYQL